ncbi:hypothetical protein FC093_14095 [Ilyomonas limi]|uniref:Uncharacterized protein n=1 Tax=Ilyomonas limi TaxID=2575867 RepID=A0A4U3L1R1_9BACT|nr:DUF6580 family putative transport protein [Ilyomonas limi]TKK67426.1 hypothetical protein FC093_14095 [Ilyomonas limi]
MKITKRIVVALVLLTAVCALYRIIPGRPWGFAPQIAMAVFGGAIFINNKKWAFAAPLLSMFLSDVLYEVLYHAGISVMPGFYEGQWQNYLLFGLLTTVGFLVKKINVLNVLLASIAAPTVYFIISNFLVWTAGAGWSRPKTLSGLMMCYNDGLPFYPNSLYSTVFFSIVLFGGYYLIQKSIANKSNQLA